MSWVVVECGVWTGWGMVIVCVLEVVVRGWCGGVKDNVVCLTR